MSREDNEQPSKKLKIEVDETEQEHNVCLGNITYNTFVYFKSFTYFSILGKKTQRLCPYLDTINRQYLDFDFEKLCSVSLTRINVYACLVCGKYFQGRGTSTHAYMHSVGESHHVFLNLHTLKFYCLPDNYEIIGKYLFVLNMNLV